MTFHARHRIEFSLAEGLQADFTLDVVGNISAIAGAGGVPVSGYGYDDLYRLTSETAPGLSLAHAYDATGNRTAETVAGATTVYAYPPDSHRLTNIGRTARTFDEAGNLRVLNNFNRSSPEYAYDDRNRMAAYRVGGRDVATYAHNARGERVRKQLPKAGTETLFVYAEGGQLLGEYDADGNLLQEYAWLDALPVAVLKKAGLHPIEPDHLGTPRRAIAPELDRAVWAWDLQGPAFGTHPANDDPDADGQPFPLNLRFPGQYLDAESNLHYNYFRDYDPATGRYVESDPVGLEGGIATYSYVTSQPLDFADADGLRPCRRGTYSHDVWGCLPNPWKPDPTPRKPSRWSITPCFGTVAPFGNCHPLPFPEFTCERKCNFWVGLACGPVASVAGDTSEAIEAWLICRALVYEGCKKKCANSCD